MDTLMVLSAAPHPLDPAKSLPARRQSVWRPLQRHRSVVSEECTRIAENACGHCRIPSVYMAVMEVRHERKANLLKAELDPEAAWWMKSARRESLGSSW